MRKITWARLFIIIVLLGLGGVLTPGNTAAQNDEESPSIFIIVSFCAELYEGEPPPSGGVCISHSEAVGTDVEITITNLTTEVEQIVTIPIGFSDPNIGGFAKVSDLPLGSYQVCETVPAGYTAYARVPQRDESFVQQDCVTFELTSGGGSINFANVLTEVEELPDTGAGLTTPSTPGTWVPVLLAGALLSVLAGGRFRTRGQE